VLHLLDQGVERLRVGDRTVGDPVLVPVQPVLDRLELALGPGLVTLEVGDGGVGPDQIGGEPAPLAPQAGDLGVLGQRAAAVLQLGERGVDRLQIEQAQLVPLVGFDRCLPSTGGRTGLRWSPSLLSRRR